MSNLFEGALSVKAILMAGKRTVEEVIIDQEKKDRDTAFIIAQARLRNVKVTRMARDLIDAQCSGKTHGGVICRALDRPSDSLQQLMEGEFICLLEGIEDPFNFGYCLRSLLAAGCDGIIVGERNWLDSATTITRSSSGASEYLPIYVSHDLGETLSTLKSKFRVVCAMRKDAVSLYDFDFQQPIVLAIGGERRGLSKAVLDLSDQNIYIPYAGSFRNALNASSAVSVAAFEIMRQRLERR